MNVKVAKLPNKLVWIIVLFTVLCTATGCLGITTSDGGQLPIRSLTITIDSNQRDMLFEQFTKFSEKHDFEILIRDSGLSDNLYQVYMSRDNIKIIAVNPFDTLTFRVRIYKKYSAFPVSEEIVDDLFNDLKHFLNEIPNVIIEVGE